MSEESSPNPSPEKSANRPGDHLAGALEDLLQGRLLGPDFPRGSPGNPFQAEAASPGAAAQGKQVRDAAPAPCPRPEEWILLLGEGAGEGEPEKVRVLLSHAADCRNCADRLRVLSAHLSPEESTLLARLDCSSVEGQRELAAKLAATPRLQRAQPITGQTALRRANRNYLWAGAALAASLLIVVGLSAWWRTAANPERLIAAAYTRDRIFDLRIPGAGFAEVTAKSHLRGGTAAREPAELADARKRIDRELETSPDDAHLLELEARSDILEEKFDPAIDILEKLVAAGPVTAGLLMDDASAYFQRGLATGSDSDRNTALDYMRRADELAPGDPVILFNEAIAMEDRGQLINAVETWNRYLRFERDPKWQAAGKRRLQALEEKLDQLKSRQGE